MQNKLHKEYTDKVNTLFNKSPKMLDTHKTPFSLMQKAPEVSWINV